MFSLSTTLHQNLGNSRKIIADSQLTDWEKNLISSIWLSSINVFEGLVQRNFRFSNYAKVTTIVCTAILPALITMQAKYNTQTFFILDVALSVISAIAVAVTHAYKFSDKWRHFREVSELLKIEGEKFFSLSGHYKSYSVLSGPAVQMFLGRIARIKSLQVVSYGKISENDVPEDAISHRDAANPEGQNNSGNPTENNASDGRNFHGDQPAMPTDGPVK